MATRAYWKGHIRIALVSIPVELYSATQTGSKISFRQIHEPSGKPIRYEKVVPGIGPVDREDIIKGFEYARDSYVLIDEDEIEAVKLESRKTLILTQFVDNHEIDALYYDKPYYVVPADELAQEAYIVLREALKRTRKVAIGQLAVRGIEHVVSLKPCGRGLLLETLRYGDEVKKASRFFDEISDAAPAEEMLDLAETLIAGKSAAFDPDEYHDRYTEALQELIARKRRAGGEKVLEDVEEHPSTSGNVVDLMAALKKSVSDESAGGKKPTRAGKSRKSS